jgi:hypothetical protein
MVWEFANDRNVRDRTTSAHEKMRFIGFSPRYRIFLKALGENAKKFDHE